MDYTTAGGAKQVYGPPCSLLGKNHAETIRTGQNKDAVFVKNSVLINCKQQYVFVLPKELNQYMPPLSGLAGFGGFFSGISATRLSVVSTMEATEAAFSRALRQTLVGSTMPKSIMSP